MVWAKCNADFLDNPYKGNMHIAKVVARFGPVHVQAIHLNVIATCIKQQNV